MSELDLLAKLSEWYSDQCNGEWEHAYGISIDTVDNPGWKVEINLKGTACENKAFQEVRIEKQENDWISCFLEEKKFVGAGDLSKLSTILELFLEFADRM